MGQIERITARGQLVGLVFMQADVAASQTDAALTVAEVRDAAAIADDQNATDAYVLPFAGEVVGISIRGSTARTAGDCTVQATVNGTASGLKAALDATNTQSHHKVQARDSDTFVAGDRVGATLTTPAGWTPIAADVVVVVWVLVYLEGI